MGIGGIPYFLPPQHIVQEEKIVTEEVVAEPVDTGHSSPDTFLPGDYKEKSLSRGYVYGPENSRAVVHLYASDQESFINQDSWGFALEGQTVATGHYALVMDPGAGEEGIGSNWSAAKIDLGAMQFNLSRPFIDGSLHSFQLDKNGYQDALGVYQYGSSNTDTISLYRYISGQFSQVHFVTKEWGTTNFTETGLGGELEQNADGTFTSEWYNNERGYETTTWRYDPRDNNLHEIETTININSV